MKEVWNNLDKPKIIYGPCDVYLDVSRIAQGKRIGRGMAVKTLGDGLRMVIQVEEKLQRRRAKGGNRDAGK